MSTAARKATGFKVPCPHCGATEGLNITVHDLSLSCSECSEDVSRDDLARLIADATRLLAWLDSATSL